MSAELTYDNLPPYSTLVRQYGDGGITITSAAQEPSEHLRRQLRLRTAISAAWISAGILAAGFALGPSFYFMKRNLITIPAIGLFAIFDAALFALIWQARYTTRLEALQRAMAQNTVVFAGRDRLLIESSGPLGVTSDQILRDSLVGIRIVHDFRRNRWGQEQPLDCLQIDRKAGEPIRLFFGRDAAELQWIARTVGEMMREA